MVASFIIDSYRHEPDLMKVIIVEVTRAANSFGRIHLEKISEAYAGIAGIVESARRDGIFKADISAEFAAMCFYGAIEQLLSGWIFDLLAADRGGVRGRQGPRRRRDLRRARGLGPGYPCRLWLNELMDNDLVKRLMWSGLLAGMGALVSIVANRLATIIWIRLFDEDPPDA